MTDDVTELFSSEHFPNEIKYLPTSSQVFSFGTEQIVCLVHETAVGLWEQQWTEAEDESQNNVEGFVTSYK